MTTAYLGLGSNLSSALGDRAANLRFALTRIAALPGTRIDAVSPVYETAPWGVSDQPGFLNLCIGVETVLCPRALLDAVLAIEIETGRERRERWGPRTLDIDILVFGDRHIHEDGLIVPHPELGRRTFVLHPLLDIAPDLVIGERTAREMLRGLDSAGIVRTGSPLMQDAE